MAFMALSRSSSLIRAMEGRRITSFSSAGRIYGHVGIYVGNGTVMDNVGFIRSIGVDEWIAYYGVTVTPRWGWIGGWVLG